MCGSDTQCQPDRSQRRSGMKGGWGSEGVCGRFSILNRQITPVKQGGGEQSDAHQLSSAHLLPRPSRPRPSPARVEVTPSRRLAHPPRPTPLSTSHRRAQSFPVMRRRGPHTSSHEPRLRSPPSAVIYRKRPMIYGPVILQ